MYFEVVLFLLHTREGGQIHHFGSQAILEAIVDLLIFQGAAKLALCAFYGRNFALDLHKIQE